MQTQRYKHEMAENILVVNDGNFETEVLTASKSQPVMVDFWAEWCRPCHMLAPTVAEIAHDYAGKLKVTKLNVDEAMNSAGKFNIRGIPTLWCSRTGKWSSRLSAQCRRIRSPRPWNATSDSPKLPSCSWCASEPARRTIFLPKGRHGKSAL